MLVVIGLASSILAYFIASFVRRYSIDTMVASILYKPDRTTRRHRLRVTRLQHLNELLSEIAQAAGVFGIPTFALFGDFRVGAPVVWIGAGFATAAAFSYPQISRRVASIARPPVCLGDDVLAGAESIPAEKTESLQAR